MAPASPKRHSYNNSTRDLSEVSVEPVQMSEPTEKILGESTEKDFLLSLYLDLLKYLISSQNRNTVTLILFGRNESLETTTTMPPTTLKNY
jgi:hypothetical protein